MEKKKKERTDESTDERKITVKPDFYLGNHGLLIIDGCGSKKIIAKKPEKES